MTDEPPPYLFEEMHRLAERVELLERDVAGMSRFLRVAPQNRPESNEDGEATVHRVIDHGAPRVDLCCPSAWRGLSDGEIAARWDDLTAWVDWLIATYRLPPRPWERWWECPGVREEVSALRAWHRALVDLPVAEMQHPPEGLDPYDEIDWHRAERTVRLEVARSHLDWHDAMWQLVGRVAGAHADLKPLLVRESESTERTMRLRDEEREARSSSVGAWLARQSSGQVAEVVDRPTAP